MQRSLPGRWVLTQTLAAGWYELQLDSDLFQDLAGNTLLGDGASVDALRCGMAWFPRVRCLLGDRQPRDGQAGYSAPTFGDYNGDGLDDLIVGEKSTDGRGRIVVFPNTGTAGAPEAMRPEKPSAPRSRSRVRAVSAPLPPGLTGTATAWSDLLVGTAGGGVDLLREHRHRRCAPPLPPVRQSPPGRSGAKSPIAVGAQGDGERGRSRRRRSRRPDCGRSVRPDSGVPRSGRLRHRPTWRPDGLCRSKGRPLVFSADAPLRSRSISTATDVLTWSPVTRKANCGSTATSARLYRTRASWREWR